MSLEARIVMSVSIEHLQHPLKTAPGWANNNTLQVEEVQVEQEVYHALLVIRVAPADIGRDYQAWTIKALREWLKRASCRGRDYQR